MSRNTTTGAVLEAMILPALNHGGYTYIKQYLMGTRPGGRRHFLDVLAQDAENDAYAISLKWQQSSGTAEAKVPYEMMSMAELRQNHPGVIRAYIILAGDGWTLKDYYIQTQLREHLIHANLVTIVGLEVFVRIANQSKLRIYQP